MDTHLGKLEQALSGAIAGMSSEELTWHPEGKWCVAEVLEHLYLSYTGTAKGFERVTKVVSYPTECFPALAGMDRGWAGLSSRGAKGSARDAAARFTTGARAVRDHSGNRTDGRNHCGLRESNGLGEETAGSSDPWPAHGEAVAEVSSGARATSCEADSAAAVSKSCDRLSRKGYVGRAARGCPGEQSSLDVSVTLLEIRKHPSFARHEQPRAALPT